jgi:3-hydroxybutyryl-CoA dehydrogenase
MSEAVRMVDEGVASAEDIDTAVRVGFGLRFAVLGLLEFTDWGGGDILYYASNYLADSLDERFRPPDLVRENMEKGHNGIREGVGFYDYRNMDVEAYRQGRIADFVGLLRAAKLTPRFNGALGENNQ